MQCVPDVVNARTAELQRKVAALRWVCLIETVTFVVLQVLWHPLHSEIGVQLLGSIHGMTFLAFAAMTLGVYKPMGWTTTYLVAVIVLGPIGAVMTYERLRRQDVPVQPQPVKQPAGPPRAAAAGAPAGAPTRSSRPTPRPPGA